MICQAAAAAVSINLSIKLPMTGSALFQQQVCQGTFVLCHYVVLYKAAAQ
jgi:hypothetical protein